MAFISFMHHNVLGYQTQVFKRLPSLKINEDDILSIIKSLNSNKSHGWDKVSIEMIKKCGIKTHFQSILFLYT